ncbi:MAG: hypothetical protein OEM67_13120 [Thermoleophilia bacterium]|nr:hypothetical protein [Thermoleophilia bacterium]
MDSSPGRRLVARIFEDEQSASKAVKLLLEEHFDPDNDLSVIASHRHERQKVPVTTNFEVGRTAALGAAIGALTVPLGLLLAGVTLGPITMAAGGPLLVALEGAYIGGATGFAFGALMSIDFAKTTANLRAVGVRDGIVWVGARAAGARGARAREILAEAGAKRFMDRELDWATEIVGDLGKERGPTLTRASAA